MAYLEVIETSQTWTCPKSADYEIICVAGCQRMWQRLLLEWLLHLLVRLLTVDGIWSQALTTNTFYIGGTGGYTFADYGGAGGIFMNTTGISAATGNGGGVGKNGIGYGAGGANMLGTVVSGGSMAGGCGKLKIKRVYIEVGTSISCTIGAGGVGSVTTGNPGVIVISEIDSEKRIALYSDNKNDRRDVYALY